MDFNGRIFNADGQVFEGSLTIYGDLTMNGTVFLADGDSSHPSLTFKNVPTMGIYQTGGSTHWTGGPLVVDSGSQVVIPNNYLLPTGPSLALAQDQTTGIGYNVSNSSMYLL